MRGRAKLSQDELVYQLHSHFVYELKWMIFASDAFRRSEGGAYVAFLESAAMHARNLLEFAAKKDPTEFTLHALGGRAVKRDAWDRWANNRVAHMTQREHDKAPWPEGRDAWEKPDKLMRMAEVVLQALREGGTEIAPGPVRDAFDEVMQAAERYLREPSTANHELLALLHDDSRDEPYPG